MPPTFRPRSGRGSAEDQDAAERAYDRRRLAEVETRRLYKLKRWLEIRAGQLLAQPLCEECERNDITTAATVVHHVEAHGGNPVKFWSGPFESVCKHCHDAVKQREEAQARRTR